MVKVLGYNFDGLEIADMLLLSLFVIIALNIGIQVLSQYWWLITLAVVGWLVYRWFGKVKRRKTIWKELGIRTV